MDPNESLSSSFQEMKEMMIKSLNSINELNETLRGHNENFRVIIAKLDLYLEKCAKPIEIVKVDKGSFNFPISSLTKLEGVGKLKLPDSILLTPNFVDPDILTFKGDFLQKPFHVLSSIRENTFCPAVSYVLKERVEKKVLYQNLMEFLIFFYEFNIRNSVFFLSVFLHLEDLLYDLYEFNIQKFLSC